MAARRAERMINLVLCLLSTRQFLTAEQIRRAVPGYEPDDATARADDAFKRMFERDKAELRDLGVPLETGRTSIFDTEDGYRIARRDYELPEIEFDPAEAAAVGLAARLWQSATLGSAARSALLKLRAGGVEVDEPTDPAVFAPLDAGEPSLGPLLEAVNDHRAVSFGYHKSGADQAQQRMVEPWGVLSWLGRWYLVGRDRHRDAPRSFRLSRIQGTVKQLADMDVVERPHGLDLMQFVRGGEREATHTATIVVTGPGAARLRRLARPVPSSAQPSDEFQPTELVIDFTDVDRLARLIAAAGPAVVVTAPDALVDAVVALLRATAHAVATGADA